MTFIRVALDVPLPTLFDYRAPDASDADIGARVVVPFGRKIATGVIVELAPSSTLPPQRIRAAFRILRDIPPLSPDLLKLLRFCSNYYQYPIGATILGALPTRLRRTQEIEAPQQRYRLSADGRALDPTSLSRRATMKQKLLHLLRESGDAGIDKTLVHATGSSAPAVLETMLKRGWIERIPTIPDFAPPSSDFMHGPTLNIEQRTALEEICAQDPSFTPWLLHGITGSGKTEIYFHAMADTLTRGQQVLMLVPEINLTPQLEAQVAARFPRTPLATLHSALNESERLHNWLAAQSGLAGIVLGTRLAVFAPLPRLGLIVIDEEQDVSFKQAEGLRYSARDVALVRAKQASIPIILGSATPALETFHQALTGRYRLLTLAKRTNAMPPQIRCIDTRRELPIDGLSQTLITALHETLKRGEQSLLFINRRGYSPVLMCRSCGWISDCQRCSARLVLHLHEGLLRCHHCGHAERVPAACPQCGNQDLLPVGQGTQRIEAAVSRLLPTARILRIDRDSTRHKHAWRDMRKQIQSRQVDILIGTQILAKGHDFPQLTLVGVINADSSLYSTDFRAGEHLYARLTQVAGRAGRGTQPGHVLIQTDFPHHPLYQALCRHDYAEFAQTQLDERRQAGLPPFVHQAVLRAEASRLAPALDFLERAIQCGARIANGVTLLDPVPAAVTRRAGLERAHMVVESCSRQALQNFLLAWRLRLEKMAERKARWVLEVDPLAW